MEKLRPILKQRYWICFGLALIFVLSGWWNASGDLAAKIDERKKSVEGSFTEAENGKSDPNALWVAAAGKKENEEDSGGLQNGFAATLETSAESSRLAGTDSQRDADDRLFCGSQFQRDS